MRRRECDFAAWPVTRRLRSCDLAVYSGWAIWQLREMSVTPCGRDEAEVTRRLGDGGWGGNWEIEDGLWAMGRWERDLGDGIWGTARWARDLV